MARNTGSKPYRFKKIRGYYYALFDWDPGHPKSSRTKDLVQAIAWAESCVDTTFGRNDGYMLSQIKSMLAYLIKRKYGDFYIEETEWIEKEWVELSDRERLAVLFTVNHGKCHYCGRKVHINSRQKYHQARATIDHMIPAIGGGADSFQNCILACNKCNIKKSDMSYNKFIETKAVENAQATPLLSDQTS